MKNYIKNKIIISVVASILLFTFMSINVFGNEVNAKDNDTTIIQSTNENLSDIIEKYIDEDSKLFNVEEAIVNNESQEVIEIGNIYNEMLKDERSGNYENVNRKKRFLKDISRYGNWCGKGNIGETTIDILDQQCKEHDLCYQSRGQWDTSCDEEFIINLANNYDSIKEISSEAKNYAIAAKLLFKTKIGITKFIELTNRNPIILKIG